MDRYFANTDKYFDKVLKILSEAPISADKYLELVENEFIECYGACPGGNDNENNPYLEYAKSLDIPKRCRHDFLAELRSNTVRHGEFWAFAAYPIALFQARTGQPLAWFCREDKLDEGYALFHRGYIKDSFEASGGYIWFTWWRKGRLSMSTEEAKLTIENKEFRYDPNKKPIPEFRWQHYTG